LAADINVVALTGRLTKDPDLQHTQGGTAVCKIRLAYSTRRKNSSGDWEDKSNYVDVTVWGGQGERCAQWLVRGRRIGVQGRLEWREWEASDGSGKRQAYEVVADTVVFLDKKDEDSGGSGEWSAPAQASGDYGVPSGTDDDIPFACIDRFDIEGRGAYACPHGADRSATKLHVW
jgi:single-strand DNA-binding protein